MLVLHSALVHVGRISACMGFVPAEPAWGHVPSVPGMRG